MRWVIDHGHRARRSPLSKTRTLGYGRYTLRGLVAAKKKRRARLHCPGLSLLFRLVVGFVCWGPNVPKKTNRMDGVLFLFLGREREGSPGTCWARYVTAF